MHFSRPYQGELHRQIAAADRIVVCDAGGKEPVYFTVTNRAEITDVVAHITFEPTLKYNPCGCCGHPGIDWFRGQKRLASTPWKHGYGLLLEDGFAGMLMPESKTWLRSWLLLHGMKENDIK